MPSKYRCDGFVNVLNKYGTSRDASENYVYKNEVFLSDEVLTAFYEGNGLYARIVDMPADDSVRNGFVLEGVNDRSTLDFYKTVYDTTKAAVALSTGSRWARAFGGALGVMLINDGRGIESPLDYANIKGIEGIQVYDRSVVQPDMNTMFSGKLGTPDRFYVFSKYGSFTVHESRCLIFKNGVLPERCSDQRFAFWGMPEYARIKRAVQDYETANSASVKMLDRSIQAVYKMKNLSQMLSVPDGENEVVRRLELLDMARGLFNTVVIDKDVDDYDFKQSTLTNVSSIVKASGRFLSAVTEIPPVILFGERISSWSKTDDTSMELYYNLVERVQNKLLKHNIRRLSSVILQSGISRKIIKEMPPLHIHFNSLWSQSAAEQAHNDYLRAEAKRLKAKTADIYVKMGALKPSEIKEATKWKL